VIFHILEPFVDPYKRPSTVRKFVAVNQTVWTPIFAHT